MRRITVAVALVLLCGACSDDENPVDTILGGLPTTHLLVTSDAVIDTDCTDQVFLVGTALDGSAVPISGAQVTLEVVPGTPTPGTLSGTFTPTSPTTDLFGAYATSFTLDGTECMASCTGAAVCTLDLQATISGVVSNTVTITESL